MPTNLDLDHTATTTDDMPPPASRLDRAVATAERGLRSLRRHVLATTSWARRQPRTRLLWAGGLTLAAVLVTVTVLRLLIWGLAGLWDLLVVSDTPAQPPVSDQPNPPPQWLVELAHSPFWSALGDNLVAWMQQQSSLTGIPAVLLLAAWAGFGAVFLLVTWFSDTRRPVSILAWWAWLAATCWTLWAHTPEANPLPAAFAFAAGVVLSVVPPWLLLALGGIAGLGIAISAA